MNTHFKNDVSLPEPALSSLCARLLLVILAISCLRSQGTGVRSWKQTSSPDACWFAIACSADGNRLIAAADGAPVSISTNAGATWLETDTPPDSWYSVASSADGVTLAASGGWFTPVPIYISTNAGSNWRRVDAPQAVWNSLACSGDGRTLAAAANDAQGGPIYISHDSGATWTNSGAPQTNWASIACSADGRKFVAAVGSYWGVFGPIFTSVDSGATWTVCGAPVAWWTSVASSADGNRLVATTSAGSGSGSVFVSANSGQTWETTSAPDIPRAIASSADGLTLAGACLDWTGGGFSGFLELPPTGRVCVSTDRGQTWTLSTNLTQRSGMCWAVCSSADGARLACAVDSGFIYTSQSHPNPALTITQLKDLLKISWIMPSSKLMLQWTTDPRAGLWTDALPIPILNSTNLRYEVTVPRRTGAAFYRLVPR